MNKLNRDLHKSNIQSIRKCSSLDMLHKKQNTYIAILKNLRTKTMSKSNQEFLANQIKNYEELFSEVQVKIKEVENENK